METSSPRLPPVAEKLATLFVALELSKSTWLVAIHSPATDKISQHRLTGGGPVLQWPRRLPRMRDMGAGSIKSRPDMRLCGLEPHGRKRPIPKLRYEARNAPSTSLTENASYEGIDEPSQHGARLRMTFA